MYLFLLVLSLACFARADDNPKKAGDKERTITALQQDIKADPDNAQLWLHLGFALRKAGQADDSLHAFEKASKLDPSDTDAFFMLGNIYESRHDTAKAKQAWNNYLAVDRNPTERTTAEDHLNHLAK